MPKAGTGLVDLHVPAGRMGRWMVAAVAAGAAWIAPLVVRSVIERVASRRMEPTAAPVEAIPRAIAIDPRLWRGPAPEGAYHELAAAGVSLAVDLRAEVDLEEVTAKTRAAGLELCWLPTPNGGLPRSTDVAILDARSARTPGVVYVHCEAGEGRTGALLGALAVARGAGIRESLVGALAIGSLTIAQLIYVARGGRSRWLCVVVDRLIDRPSERLFDLARARVTTPAPATR